MIRPSKDGGELCDLQADTMEVRIECGSLNKCDLVSHATERIQLGEVCGINTGSI